MPYHQFLMGKNCSQILLEVAKSSIYQSIYIDTCVHDYSVSSDHFCATNMCLHVCVRHTCVRARVRVFPQHIHIARTHVP